MTRIRNARDYNRYHHIGREPWSSRLRSPNPFSSIRLDGFYGYLNFLTYYIQTYCMASSRASTSLIVINDLSNSIIPASRIEPISLDKRWSGYTEIVSQLMPFHGQGEGVLFALAVHIQQIAA